MTRPTDAEIIAEAEDLQAHIGEPRCLFIAGGLAMVGLAWADKNTRDAYVEEIFWKRVFPVVDGQYQMTAQQRSSSYQMAAAQSSCGTTTRAIWRYAGVDDPQIYDFYGQGNRIGTAVGHEIQFAQSQGAWVSGTPWVEGTELPREGDANVIGCASCGSGFVRGGGFNGEHEFTTICWLDGLMHSVDGGQPGIGIRTRALVEVWTGTNSEGIRTGELWAGAVDAQGRCALGADGRPLNGRRYVGFTDVSKLPYRAENGGCGFGSDDRYRYGDEGGPSVVGALARGVGIGALALGALWAAPRIARYLKSRRTRNPMPPLLPLLLPFV